MTATTATDPLVVAGETLTSRLLLGTGGFSSMELLRDATELVPGVSELVVEEVSAGLRPGSPDHVPLVESRGRVVVATGHFRNGVLLAPVTADRVLALLTREPVAA